MPSVVAKLFGKEHLVSTGNLFVFTVHVCFYKYSTWGNWQYFRVCMEAFLIVRLTKLAHVRTGYGLLHPLRMAKDEDAVISIFLQAWVRVGRFSMSAQSHANKQHK